ASGFLRSRTTLRLACPRTVCNSEARPGSPRPGASILMTSAHSRQIPCGCRASDDPTAVEDANIRERERSRSVCRAFPTAADDLQSERRARCLHTLLGDPDCSPEAAVLQLRRNELLGRLTQWETRHMGGLSRIGDPLLVVVSAPSGH